MLYYDAAVRRSGRLRAANLVDNNLAFAGGKEAEGHLKKLNNG